MSDKSMLDAAKICEDVAEEHWGLAVSGRPEDRGIHSARAKTAEYCARRIREACAASHPCEAPKRVPLGVVPAVTLIPKDNGLVGKIQIRLVEHSVAEGCPQCGQIGFVYASESVRFEPCACSANRQVRSNFDLQIVSGGRLRMLCKVRSDGVIAKPIAGKPCRDAVMIDEKGPVYEFNLEGCEPSLVDPCQVYVVPQNNPGNVYPRPGL